MKIRKGLMVILLAFTVGFSLGFSLAAVFFHFSPLAPPSQLTLEQRYNNAVRDAMVTEDNKTCSLIPITETNSQLIWLGEGANKSVLVVTWTKFGSSFPVGNVVNTTWGDSWVTVVPQIKQFFETHPTSENDLTLRMEELLGLPANNGNLYFVELWVKPKDLFRPTPNNEIDDTIADLTLPANVNPTYRKWFEDQVFFSYYQAKQYPWTRLGYTYDWGNPNSKCGMSEFVIRPNSLVVVKSKAATVDFLKVTEAPNSAETGGPPYWYAQYSFLIAPSTAIATVTIAALAAAIVLRKRRRAPR